MLYLCFFAFGSNNSPSRDSDPQDVTIEDMGPYPFIVTVTSEDGHTETKRTELGREFSIVPQYRTFLFGVLNSATIPYIPF